MFKLIATVLGSAAVACLVSGALELGFVSAVATVIWVVSARPMESAALVALPPPRRRQG